MTATGGIGQIMRHNQAMSRCSHNIDGRPRDGSWGRKDDDYQFRWLHGDMKDMALFYTYRFFDQVVTDGGLR